MKKIVYVMPAILALILYLYLALAGGFGAIHPIAWVCVALLFVSGVLMARRKWWGCLFGVSVGGLLLYMGTQSTGQIINEMPIGLVLCAFYAISGFAIYQKRKQ